MNNPSFPRLGETSGGISREKIMVLERGEENKNFHGVSPILIGKTIEAYCGKVVNTKKTKEGKIFVTVKNEKQAKDLEKISKFTNEITVKVYEHKSLNHCKAVVFCRDLKDETDADVAGSLSNQNVKEVKQIVKGREGNYTPTGIFVLTINGMVPPKNVKIGYLVLETRPWYPNPLRCYVCLKFGHIGKNCGSEKKCSKCGENFHEQCGNAEKCVNCGGEHGAFDRECPALKKEKAIIKVKVDNNVNFWEARKMVDSENKSPYADSVKVGANQQVEENIRQCNEEKRTYAETIKAELEKQFEEKFQNYRNELNKIMQENERKFNILEEKYENERAKCSQLVQAHQAERQKRKTAESDLEQLKQSYARLQATLSLYTQKKTTQKKASKHTRSQEHAAASPPRKKGNTMMAVTEEIEYMQSESEDESEEENEEVQQ